MYTWELGMGQIAISLSMSYHLMWMKPIAELANPVISRPLHKLALHSLTIYSLEEHYFDYTQSPDR